MTQLGEKSVLSYEPAGIIEIFNLLLFPRYSWPKQRPRVIDHPLEMQPSSLTPRTTANIIKYFGLFIPTKKKKKKNKKERKKKIHLRAHAHAHLHVTTALITRHTHSMCKTQTSYSYEK
jgi:hypothetical protein